MLRIHNLLEALCIGSFVFLGIGSFLWRTRFAFNKVSPDKYMRTTVSFATRIWDPGSSVETDVGLQEMKNSMKNDIPLQLFKLYR